jgi:signal transduction histidine kinase
VTGVAVFSRDISELKQYETALKKAKEELETRVDERTASLAKANEQIRQMTFQLIKAEEQERMRIAAELHDQVGQSLLLAKMKVDALASDTATDKNDNNSADISRLLEDCIQDIRSLTFAMRPPLLDTAGFESALQWLCKSIYEDYRVKIDFSTSCQSIQLNSEQRYSLYQAVRELLLNVVKHAGVTHAELSLKTAGSDLIIQVSDKGSGFDTKTQPCTSAAGLGFGLFNVSQRVHLLGGCCHLDTQPGKGTIATLTVPMGE